MRILGFLLILVTFSLGAVQQAQARAPVWNWFSSKWHTYDFQPYIGDELIRQRSLWDKDTWTPEAWIEDAGDERRIMRDFYAVNILEEQYRDSDDIPVLEVGEVFTRLSGIDQRRILKFIDHVFEITTSEENGMFYVTYEQEGDDEELMGIYNKHGFQSY